MAKWYQVKSTIEVREVNVVIERLGHSTVTLTLDVYSHVIPGLQEAVAPRFDGILGWAIEITTPANDEAMTAH